MKSQLADFLSLIYPRTCFYCGEALTKTEEHLCLPCELNLPVSSSLSNKNELLTKFSYIPSVSAAFAYLEYKQEGMSQKLVQGIKYQGKRKLGKWLGGRFARIIQKQLLTNIDLILPLPIHKRRERARGYNQSEVICEGMAEVLDLPMVTDCIRRAIHTKTQTKKKKLDRWENMESVFEVTNPDAIESRNILILDDVITTGATMGMFCQELAKYQPNSIIVTALAAGK